MRQYTVSFMEQMVGVNRLTPVPGPAGEARFEALDDDSAITYLTDHLLQRVKDCARAEISSMAIIEDAASPEGRRCMDDSLVNPYCQDIYVKFDARRQRLDVDFESTRSTVIPSFLKRPTSSVC